MNIPTYAPPPFFFACEDPVADTTLELKSWTVFKISQGPVV